MKIFFFLFVLSFGNFLFSQNNIVFSKIKEDCYVYTTFNEFNGLKFPSNSMYLVVEEGVVLIDTPWDTLQFQVLLDSIYARHHKKVILAISTHFHDDRTAGLTYFKKLGIKTFTSKKTQEYCEKRNEPKAEFTFLNDTTFTFSNLILETYYPGEGHSPDNIVIYIPKVQILFGGCLIKSLENNSLGNIADANLKAWDYSVKNVKNKFPDAKIVIPGHFKWGNKKLLQHTMNLLKKHKK